MRLWTKTLTLPGAIAALFDLSKEVNTLLNSGQEISKKCLEDIDKLYQDFGGNILGIFPKTFESEQKGEAGVLDNVMRVLIDTRNELRKAKQWQLSDFIRNKLTEIGIALDDKPDSTSWKRIKK